MPPASLRRADWAHRPGYRSSVLIAACAVLGLLVGSFLNVVIARVPAGESIVRPGSHCRCGAPIAPRDNIPVVSWLLLRGRARCCGARITARYPAVELATAAAFAVVAAWATGAWAPGLLGEDPTTAAADALIPQAWSAPWPLPAFLYFAAVSIALAVIDVQHHRLPFWIVVPSWWVGCRPPDRGRPASGAPRRRPQDAARRPRPLGLLPAAARDPAERHGLRRRAPGRADRPLPRVHRLGRSGRRGRSRRPRGRRRRDRGPGGPASAA